MNVLQRVGASVKAFQMRFARSTYASWQWAYQTAAERWRTNDIGQGLQSSVVMAPLAWMQRNFPEAPLRIRRKDGKEYTDIEPGDSGPGALLALWDNPNEYYTGIAMVKALVADYKTTGNAYVLKIRNPGSKRWVESWWAPSWMMKPRWPDDGSEFLSHWDYNPDGVPQRIETEDVIHFRDGIDPRNTRLGFSAFASLIREIFTDEEASRFTSAILSNLGVPGVVISPAAATLNGGGSSRTAILDAPAVKRAFKQTFGGENRGDAMVMSSPTDVHVLSFNPQQLTLRDLRKIPEERVSGVFGVPAIVAGMGAGLDRSTFANFAEAREAGYEENIIPTQRDFSAILKKHALTEFVSDPKPFVVDFDLSEVRVLQEDQNKLWERSMKALSGGGITRRRFKEIVGEEPEENDLDDVYYIPAAVVVTPKDEDQTVPEADKPPEPNPLTLPPANPAVPAGNGNGNGGRVPVTA
jgi:HK97 family phage portal protein